MDTGYIPRVAAPVPLIEIIAVLHRVQHQHLALQILIPFGSHDIFIDLDLDVGTDRQPQFLVALHLLDNSLAPDPSLEGRPVPFSQVQSFREVGINTLLVALGATLFKLLPRFARGSYFRGLQSTPFLLGSLRFARGLRGVTVTMAWQSQDAGAAPSPP